MLQSNKYWNKATFESKLGDNICFGEPATAVGYNKFQRHNTNLSQNVENLNNNKILRMQTIRKMRQGTHTINNKYNKNIYNFLEALDDKFHKASECNGNYS